MEIAITSTDQIVTLDGVPCRLWKGTTEKGIPCSVYVHRIRVRAGDDSEQFDQELMAQDPPQQERVLPKAT